MVRFTGTGWIIAGKGIWEYRLRALAMIEHYSENHIRKPHRLETEASRRTRHHVSTPCRVLCLGPPVVWCLKIDDSKLIPGTTVHTLKTTGQLYVYECFSSQFYVAHDHAEAYQAFVDRLPRLMESWTAELGIPPELHSRVMSFLEPPMAAPLTTTLAQYRGIFRKVESSREGWLTCVPDHDTYYQQRLAQSTGESRRPTIVHVDVTRLSHGSIFGV